MSALRTCAAILLACTLCTGPVLAQELETLQTTIPNNVWEFENVHPTSWYGQVLTAAIDLLGLEKKSLLMGDAVLSRDRFADALAQVLAELERRVEAGTVTALTRSRCNSASPSLTWVGSVTPLD